MYRRAFALDMVAAVGIACIINTIAGVQVHLPSPVTKTNNLLPITVLDESSKTLYSNNGETLTLFWADSATPQALDFRMTLSLNNGDRKWFFIGFVNDTTQMDSHSNDNCMAYNPSILVDSSDSFDSNGTANQFKIQLDQKRNAITLVKHETSGTTDISFNVTDDEIEVTFTRGFDNGDPDDTQIIPGMATHVIYAVAQDAETPFPLFISLEGNNSDVLAFTDITFAAAPPPAPPTPQLYQCVNGTCQESNQGDNQTTCDASCQPNPPPPPPPPPTPQLYQCVNGTCQESNQGDNQTTCEASCQPNPPPPPPPPPTPQLYQCVNGTCQESNQGDNQTTCEASCQPNPPPPPPPPQLYACIGGACEKSDQGDNQTTCEASCHPPPTPPPTPAPTSAPVSRPPITGTVRLDDRLVLEWEINQGENTMTYTLVLQEMDAWLGFGYSENMVMIGSDVVVCHENDTVPTATEYMLFQRNEAGVAPITDDPDPFLKLAACSITTEATVLTFTKEFWTSADPGSINSNVSAISAAGQQYVWAYGNRGDRGDPKMLQHPSTQRGVQRIQIQPSTGGAPFNPHVYKIVHGILMGFGLGVLMPLGALLASFFKAKLSGGLWFSLHWKLQLVGVIFMLVGVIIAVYFVEESNMKHFSTTHSLVGGITVLFVTMQLFGALARPPLSDNGRNAWSTWHRWNGRIALMGAVAAISLGLHQMNVDMIIVIIYVAAAGSAFIGLGVSKMVTKSNNYGDDSSSWKEPSFTAGSGYRVNDAQY